MSQFDSGCSHAKRYASQNDMNEQNQKKTCFGFFSTKLPTSTYQIVEKSDTKICLFEKFLIRIFFQNEL